MESWEVRGVQGNAHIAFDPLRLLVLQYHPGLGWHLLRRAASLRRVNNIFHREKQDRLWSFEIRASRLGVLELEEPRQKQGLGWKVWRPLQLLLRHDLFRSWRAQMVGTNLPRGQTGSLWPPT